MIDYLRFEGQLTWNIPLLACLIGIAVIYLYSLKRLTTIKYYDRRPILFCIGLGLFYLTVGSPLTSISHLSFSLHMIQMSILYFIIPPVLILNIPNGLFQKILQMNMIQKASRCFLSAKMALTFFAILFLIYHFPFTLTLFSENPFVHTLYNVVLMVLSFKMWWPLVSPDPSQRLKHDRLKRYTFLSGVLLMPACLLFIISSFIDGTTNPFLAQLTAHLCLPAGTDPFTVLPYSLHTSYDQVTAGILMLSIHKISLVVTSKISSNNIAR